MSFLRNREDLSIRDRKAGVLDASRYGRPVAQRAPFCPGADTRVGGKGIQILRHFADELSYELTPTGNRLKIGFSAANFTL